MKLSNICTALILTLGLSTPCFAKKTVGVTQIVEHPSLNKIREGLASVLTDHYGDKVELIYESAHGNPTVAAQIAQKFAGMSLDIIVPISTPSAQAILNTGQKAPVIFTAVSDPIAANIVEDLQHPGGNRTGVMDAPPVEEQVKFIRDLFPGVKTIGYPYNPGEPNSVVVLTRLQSLGETLGFVIFPAAVTKSADVGLGAQSLVGKADVVFIANDNTIVSGLEALIKVCRQNNMPLFASDPESVDRGAYAALAYDQTHVGEEAGKLAVRILEGEDAGSIAVVTPTKLITKINPKASKPMGGESMKEELK